VWGRGDGGGGEEGVGVSDDEVLAGVDDDGGEGKLCASSSSRR
jgi:hypothetical protein